jgi:hypothetical protein
MGLWMGNGRCGWAAVATLGAGALTRLALGGPLDPSVIDKNAAWVCHLDVEAGYASTCGKYLKEQMDEPGTREALKAELWLSPADIKSATVYGFKPGEDDGIGVLVTSASMDGPGLAAHLKNDEKVSDFEMSMKGETTRCSWKDADGHVWHVALRSHGEDRLVVVAANEKLLDTGLSVVTGAGASLQGADPAAVAPLLQKPSKGSILFVAVRGLANCAKLQATLFKQADSILIDVGEEQGKDAKETYARIQIDAQNAAMATNMQQVVQGLIGMASIAARNNDVKGVPESLQGIKVTAEGQELVISARESSEDLVKQLKSLGASIEAGQDGKMGFAIKQAKEDRSDKSDKKAEPKDSEKQKESEKAKSSEK